MNANSLGTNLAGINPVPEIKKEQEQVVKNTVEEQLINFSFSESKNAEIGDVLISTEDYLPDMDTDGDGQVTKNEIIEFIKSLFHKEENKDLTDELDANGDGIITQEEVDAYNKANPGEELAKTDLEKIEELYDEEEKDYLPELDANGDGKVSEDEILGFLEGKIKGDKEEEDISGELDANGDGIITQEELDDYNYRTQDISGELDANGDGKITQDEVDDYNKKQKDDGSENSETTPNIPSFIWSGDGTITFEPLDIDNIEEQL